MMTGIAAILKRYRLLFITGMLLGLLYLFWQPIGFKAV
jgi:threonine/homoserine/homoserine lactone efflux protein